jgi:8-oxo-dGTP pyrophosphatase MutT (NUDIX family)
MKMIDNPAEYTLLTARNKENLYSLIRDRLENHQHKTHKYADKPYRDAAVLIPLFFKDDHAHILFTKRTDKVEHHKGQISFPGGMKDESDKNLLDTALRESWEEMGIRQKDVTILGKSDTFLTNTNFMVTPFVGYYPYPYDYLVNEGEIAQVIEVPLSHLLDPNIFETKIWERDGYVWNVHFYHYNGEQIWGVTGFLLSNFLDIVFGTNRLKNATEGTEKK